MVATVNGYPKVAFDQIFAAGLESMRRGARVLDQYGQPFGAAEGRDQLAKAKNEVIALRREIAKTINSKYDAAQESLDTERHWQNADAYSPDSANSYLVRRKARMRSRYEIVENNPYLKGTILTLVNDFIGTGPKLQIIDSRIPKKKKQDIEQKYTQWQKSIRYRRILQRMRLAKLVDGEGFKLSFHNRRLKGPIKLDFKVVEADQCTTNGITNPSRKERRFGEVDGIDLDENGIPLFYHFLTSHPGASFTGGPIEGEWIASQFVTHWFREDRPWHRGIPELITSLKLCALLRRYTLATVKAAETAADFAAVLETEGPPSQLQWTDGNGNLAKDDPFDMFPIEQGMFVTMPWGYKLKQLDAKYPAMMYDVFSNALLREIVRPICVPFNITAGTSKDSNMASAVVDIHIYRGAIAEERIHCEESVCDPDLESWWTEASLNGHITQLPTELRTTPALHRWRWDRVGIDHTDPEKVENAKKIARDAGFITDRQIQEEYYNRDVEDWREEVAEDVDFRLKTKLMVDPNAAPAAGAGTKAPKVKPTDTAPGSP